MVNLSALCLLSLASGAVADPTEPLKAKVWRPSHKDFEYPEKAIKHLEGRDNFGIALAGGGLRGMALAHGATRTLRKAGMLDRSRYLSLTSGSIWFGVPFYYQTQDSIDDFLGEYIPPDQASPEELTSDKAGTMVTRLMWPITKFPKGKRHSLQALNETLGAHMETLQQLPAFAKVFELLQMDISGCFESPCKCIVNKIIPDMHEAWMLLTMLLLHPFKVMIPNAVHTHELEQQRVAEQLGLRTHILVSQDVKNELPFLISQSSILALSSGSDEAQNPLVAYPYENTPLYSGVPVALTGDLVGPEDIVGLGDLLVEPFASYSEALEKVADSAQSEVAVQRRPQWLNLGDLGDWQGAATCYTHDWQIRPKVVDLAEKFPCLVPLGEKFMPHGHMWSPLDTDPMGVPITRQMPVADAGVYDDIGHLPLLRRGVKKIVMMDSSAVHDNSSGIEDSNLEEMVYLKAAWGAASTLPFPYPKGSPNPMMAKDYLTVFEPSEFPALWEKLQQQRKMDEPCVVRGRFTVVDNPHWGIKGGWQVDLVIVAALPSKLFRSQLPVETGTVLPRYFPNVISSEPTSQLEMSALSQYSSWLYRHFVLKEIRAMLDDEPLESQTWV